MKIENSIFAEFLNEVLARTCNVFQILVINPNIRYWSSCYKGLTSPPQGTKFKHLQVKE